MLGTCIDTGIMEPPQPSLAHTSALERSHSLPYPASYPFPYLVAFIMMLLVYATRDRRKTKLPPLVNPPKWTDWSGSSIKSDFVENGEKIMPEATMKFGDQPYTVISDTGRIIVLPVKFLDEVRNDPRLSFSRNAEEDFLGHLPGFQPFKADNATRLLVLVGKNQLTKLLTKVTKPISDEASFALNHVLGASSEWQEMNIVSTSVKFISRISSRVFLGPEICRNERWLSITSQYTVNVFMTAFKLRIYPAPLRRIMNWILPGCRLVRAQIAEARTIIQPIVDKRKEERLAAAANGQPIPRYNDAIQWAEEESTKAMYDPVYFQLALSNAAIHTTTDLLSQTLMNLMDCPELVDALRKEIIEVVGQYGWKKTSLYNLRLMDSVLKETQRLKPITLATLGRVAEADIRLSDGTVIPEGAKCMVMNSTRYDPAIYKDPDVFDGYRYLRMREVPGKENQAQLVSTSAEALGFGHGMHACPGRFFATNEIKVALCHLLMKYDIKPASNIKPRAMPYGFTLNADKSATILIRRREAEIDLDHLE